MACDAPTLRAIYRCTAGYCHRCRRKLAFTGYARPAVRGAWDIDACLRPACAPCLVAGPRGHVPQDMRRAAPIAAAHAPRTPARAARTSTRHTILGGLLGAFFAGPWGALLGGLLGAIADGGER